MCDNLKNGSSSRRKEGLPASGECRRLGPDACQALSRARYRRARDAGRARGAGRTDSLAAERAARQSRSPLAVLSALACTCFGRTGVFTGADCLAF